MLYLSKPSAKHPTWRIRGEYLGVRVGRATGTDDKAVAKKILADIKDDIERGRFASSKDTTFQSAALSYLRRGGDKTFIKPLVKHFGTKVLKLMTQEDIDEAAVKLYPNNSPASHNRQVYTPVSAVMKAAGFPFVRTAEGGQIKMQRPKGAQGTPRLRWLRPPEAFAIFQAARNRAEREGTDAADRFAVLLIFLCYTGARISEALRVEFKDLELDRAFCYCGVTKNGQPRAVHLPQQVVDELATLEPPKDPRNSSQVFGRTTRARDLYMWFREVCAAAGVHVPPRLAFHIFRHTYAAWMRRYGGLDTSGLVATGAWRSRASASIYEHVDTSEEARKSDMLPIGGRRTGATLKVV
jgi:integrase